MPSQNFITKLNWRQILVHFIGTWFFMHSFKVLAFLNDTRFIEFYRHSNTFNDLEKTTMTASDLIYFSLWLSIGSTIGLLVAFMISLIITIKRKWSWVNSFIVLCLGYMLSWFDLLGWGYLKYIFLAPGQIFNNIKLEFLTDGLILLVFGFIAFFWKNANQFIEGGIPDSNIVGLKRQK